jgi:malate synthase
VLDDGTKVTAELVREMIPKELAKIKASVAGSSASYERAAVIFEQMSTGENFEEFLTLPLYEEI